jgi:hypothetical protein
MKYTIVRSFVGNEEYEVEADTPEAALELYKQGKSRFIPGSPDTGGVCLEVYPEGAPEGSDPILEEDYP